jgi:tetratricopeptide (TPR) repeat protein
MLGVTERCFRSWERHELIELTEVFAFQDLIALRTLIKLQEGKIPLQKIRAALAALRERLSDVSHPLKELKVISNGRRIQVEINGQQMEPMSGQLLLDLGRVEVKRLLTFPQNDDNRRTSRQSAEQWFQKGLEFEQSGVLPDAIKAYETAVKLDPQSAGAWLNLGTIFFNARQYNKAEGCYTKALAADPSYALAHFNLANLHDEKGDNKRALHHYGEAVRLHPSYADAHYNLALLHQGAGHVMDAVRHWKTYLKLDPGSTWGAIARRELEKLRKSTVVQGTRRASKKKSAAGLLLD